MKRPLLAIAASAFGVALFTSAQAGEWADACAARLEADGRDTSGCYCLEEEITANPALAEDFAALSEIEDPAERYAAASSEAQAAMDKCTR